MADDNEALSKGQGTGAHQTARSSAGTTTAATAEPEDIEHYEEVSEYRIGEGPPPIALIVMFVLIVAWATLSWIPFFGY